MTRIADDVSIHQFGRRDDDDIAKKLREVAAWIDKTDKFYASDRNTFRTIASFLRSEARCRSEGGDT